MIKQNDKKIIKSFIEDCKHMIHARKLRYDDMTCDKSLLIFCCDGYEDKPIYKDIDVASIYYNNEDLIHYILSNHIERQYFK